MNEQMIFNILVGAVLAGLGWFGREVWAAVKTLREDLHTIEVQLPKVYVTKTDHDARMDKIEDMFQRIFDKIDGKADKR